MEKTIETLAREIAQQGVQRLPRPRGFMPGRVDGQTVEDAQFFASPYVEDGKFYMLVQGPCMIIWGSPGTYALAGARNLAAAYRPEGLP